MLIIFFFISFLILLSTLGYGQLLYNIIEFKSIKKNFSILGFLGLYLLSTISSYSHLVGSHNYIFNIFLICTGITILIFFYLKNQFSIKHVKYIFYIFFLLFIAFLLSKNNEDYPYYHLPNAIQFAQQKLQFGLGNLNHGFKHISSLFMLMSIHYIPVIEHYLFNLTNYLFYVFLIFFSIFEITKQKNENLNFSKLYLSVLIILFLVKFSRLAEFGSDISGQILISVHFFYLIELFFNKKLSFLDRARYIKISLILLVFAATIKFILVIYSLPFFLFLYLEKNKKKLLKSFFCLPYLLIIFLPILFFLFFNFASTGCLIYPVEKTCFSNIYWALSSETVGYLNLHYETWAKGGKGPNFETDDPAGYVNSFNWITNWISVYFFNKFSDYLLVIFSIILLITVTFKKKIFNKKNIKTRFKKIHLKIYIALIVILLIWFFNFPTLRYGGYLIVFLIISLPYVLILSTKIDLKNKIIFNKMLALFFLSYSIFVFKNLNRLDLEFNKLESQHHNFINFPFYWVEKVDYKKISVDGYDIYLTNSKCWDVPSTCVRNIENLNIKKINNYLIYYKDDE